MDKKDLILSIETSGYLCGVSLSDSSGNLEYSDISEKNSHDRLLADLIKEILKKSNILIDDLSAVAVSGGPGSFTGLRIGVAMAKGLCYESNIRFIPVGTMAAIAYSVVKSERLITDNIIRIAVNSHKDKFYIQDFSGNFDILSEVINTGFESIKNSENNVVYYGPGVNQNIDLFRNASLAINIDYDLSSRIIDSYARKLYNDNFYADAQSYVPYYIQDFIPKIKQEIS